MNEEQELKHMQQDILNELVKDVNSKKNLSIEKLRECFVKKDIYLLEAIDIQRLLRVHHNCFAHMYIYIHQLQEEIETLKRNSK